MAREYNLMSADGHLEVPPERWVHRVPQKYRDRAPHTVHLPDGGDALMIEGQPLLEANFLDLRAGRAEGTWQPFGLKVADAAGTGSPEQRVKEQDQDGMDAEVLFAAMVAGPAFWRNIAHDEVYRAVTGHAKFAGTGPRVSQPTFTCPMVVTLVMQGLLRPFLVWLCNF